MSMSHNVAKTKSKESIKKFEVKTAALSNVRRSGVRKAECWWVGPLQVCTTAKTLTTETCPSQTVDAQPDCRVSLNITHLPKKDTPIISNVSPTNNA